MSERSGGPPQRVGDAAVVDSDVTCMARCRPGNTDRGRGHCRGDGGWRRARRGGEALRLVQERAYFYVTANVVLSLTAGLGGAALGASIGTSLT